METIKAIIITTFVLALVTVSCVLPETATTSGSAGPLMVVNGRDVTHAEIVKSPVLKTGLQQFCVLDTLWIEFASRGHAIDEEKIAEQLKTAKDNAGHNLETWGEFLRRISATEQDFVENLRINQAIETMTSDYIDLSEENLLDQWETMQDYYGNVHVTQLNLTENEKQTLTFEDVKETLIERYTVDQTGVARETLFQDLIDKSNLNLTCLTDPIEKTFFEDMILNNSKSDYEWPELEEEAEETPGSNDVSVDEPVGDPEMDEPADDEADSVPDEEVTEESAH